MLFCTFAIGFLLVWTVNGYDCPSKLPKACRCQKIGEDYVTTKCSYGGSEVTITKIDSEIIHESHTTIYCYSDEEEEELNGKQLNEIVPALELGTVEYVKIDLLCPLGEVTVQNYLDRLGLTSVHYLLLFGKQISKITKEIFAGATSIDNLNLYHNDIETLPSGVFDHLVNLTTIDLSENVFKSFPENVFSNNNKLRKFLFRRNRQNLTLPSGFLSDLPSLETAILQNSQILSVPADLFTGSVNVKSISLATNSLKTIPETLFNSQIRLVDLHLDENELKVLPDNLFKSNVELKILNLSSNKLVALPANLFENNKKLQKIDFGANEIQTIPDHLFSSLDALEELDLRMNQIQRLTAAMLPAHIISLALYKNQLEVIDSSFLKRFERGMYVHFTIGENPIRCECNDDLRQLAAVSSKLKAFVFYRCGNVNEFIVDVIDKCKQPQS